MQKNRSLEIMVGFFIVLGFAAALFMALQAANLGSFSFGHKTYAVTADFDNIGGLKARAAVKSAGVVVGRVRSVVFDPETFQARVTMDMDAQYPFPDDSSAKILTSGLLGEQYVGIEAGADDKNLEEGSVIRRTQSAVVLENLISQFLYSKAEDGGK
ncbi:outer membrane lipid asymmetry maintenance protein MlaD [Sutterella seckii]|uniref:Outer membrane lipid asymmetry maintenance protein MlaD n=1 Tax=Sutterella seckii TaxID=1944635 RepID=A0A6I1ETY1_9BURK|nr:outer membrane lipid asymmetry maintenance protein MlaD [Sutterella seckii]KAB7662851.1 outer membrane lipid asymmetry maintenance protein MlaD [Sutterella seckii]MBS5216746.1 outer membrane lipid asymmetry maintenance protein MlaD [Sutterella wadsworthensis]